MMTVTKTECGDRIGDLEFIWARNSKEFLFANSIYIRGKPAIIIDPSATFTYIEQLALTQSVNLVINSHYHADHRSLNGLFNHGVLFASHQADSACIRDYATYEEFADNDPNSIYSQWRKQVFEKYHIKNAPVARMLKDQEVIDTGSVQITVHHIPGHTPGHLAFHFQPMDILFLSDIDLTPYGPWYANVHSDIDLFRESVAKMAKVTAKGYVTSHGERIYTPERYQEKIARFAKHFDDRDEKILDYLKTGPQEFIHIASQPIVYRSMALKDPLKAYFQWQMVEKHLARLVEKNLVVRDGDFYGLVR